MINVNFIAGSAGELIGFHIMGHSGYAHDGNDIVCAAVSSAAYMVVNTLTEVVGIDPKKAEVNDAQLLFEIAEEDFADCGNILKGFKIHIDGLCKQYEKYIEIS